MSNVRSLVSLGKDGEWWWEETMKTMEIGKCPHHLLICDVLTDEGRDYQIVDGNKDSNVMNLRKRVQEALRAKLDDDLAVCGSLCGRFGVYDLVLISP